MAGMPEDVEIEGVQFYWLKERLGPDMGYAEKRVPGAGFSVVIDGEQVAHRSFISRESVSRSVDDVLSEVFYRARSLAS